MESILIGIHVLAAIVITGLVLMQHGKGADMGASFGSGASQTMFGSVGSGNFLTKSTTLMTVVFFATSLGLAMVASNRAAQGVQDSGLISGDVEQITAEQRTAAEEAAQNEDLPAVGNDIPSDIPVVDGDSPAEGDVPAAPETTQEQEE